MKSQFFPTQSPQFLSMEMERLNGRGHTIMAASKRKKKRRLVGLIARKNKRFCLLFLPALIGIFSIMFFLVPILRNTTREQNNIVIGNNNNNNHESIENTTPIPICHEPGSPYNYTDPRWIAAFKKNILTLKQLKEQSGNQKLSKNNNLDIVIYGDSITEHWFRRDEREVFDKYFTKNSTLLSSSTSNDKNNVHRYEGLGLGISGDTTGNLLWRLQNGEMPSTLRSKVWWILIGTNDYTRGDCSGVAVYEGIVGVLNHVLEKAMPDEYIVVNAIFPRGDKDPEIIKRIQITNELISKHITDMGSDQVKYFEMWDAWLVSNPSDADDVTMNETLMSDRLHPGALGYDMWGLSIVEYLQNLIKIDESSTTTKSEALPKSLCADTTKQCRCKPPAEPYKENNALWEKSFNENTKTVQDASPTEKTLDLVIYGDSITQWWFRRDENRKVFDKYFTKNSTFLSSSTSNDNEDVHRYEGLGIGIAGDTTGNLLWRLQNGEMPSSLRSKVWWILIGTNDYTRGDCSGVAVYEGIVGVLNHVSEKAMPDEYIVVNAIFPRGISTSKRGMQMLREIKITNELISKHITDMGSDQVKYFEMWDAWLSPNEVGHAVMNETLMPDRLHPSALGYDMWGQRIAEYIEYLSQIN